MKTAEMRRRSARLKYYLSRQRSADAIWRTDVASLLERHTIHFTQHRRSKKFSLMQFEIRSRMSQLRVSSQTCPV